MCYILRALNAVDRTRLERYEQLIVDLDNKYGGAGPSSCWWLIALGDIRMRSEHMDKIFSRLESAQNKFLMSPGAAAGDGPLPDELRPWNAVWHHAAEDSEKFWFDEVKEKALLFANHLKTKAELVSDGHGMRTDGDWSDDEGPRRKRRRQGKRERWGAADAAPPGVNPRDGPGDNANPKGKGKGKRKGKRKRQGERKRIMLGMEPLRRRLHRSLPLGTPPHVRVLRWCPPWRPVQQVTRVTFGAPVGVGGGGTTVGTDKGEQAGSAAHTLGGSQRTGHRSEA